MANYGLIPRGARLFEKFERPKPLGSLVGEYHPERSVRWELLDSEKESVDDIWKQVSKEHNLFNGDLFNYDSHTVLGDGRVLVRGRRAEYKEHQAQALGRDLGEAKISEDAQRSILPFASIAMVYSSDGKACTRVRKEFLVKGKYETSLGALCVVKDGRIDPLAALVKGLERELGLKQEDLDMKKSGVTGISNSNDYTAVIATHRISSNLTAERIDKRIKENKKTEVMWIGEERIPFFIRNNYPSVLDDFVGTAVANLPDREAREAAEIIRVGNGEAAIVGI